MKKMPLTPDQEQWLFAAKEIAKAKKPAPPKGQACRTCEHMVKHYYTEKINYCGIQHSPRTASRLAKVKRLGWCDKWTPKTLAGTD